MSEISKPADSITIHSASGYQNIYLHNIEYLEAQNKKVLICLYNGSKIEAFGTLSYYEKLLPVEKGFFKCHRSYLVYLQNVDHFTAAEITTKSGRNIPVSRGYAKAFKEAYFAQMFQDS